MITINLMPTPMILAQSRRRHLRRWGISIGTAAIALLLAIGNAWLQRKETDRLRSEEALILAALDEQRVLLRAVTAESNQVQAHVQRADALRAKRAWSRLLGVIGTALPGTSWLTNLSTDPARPAGIAARTMSPPTATGANAPAANGAGAAPVVMIDAPRKLRLVGYAIDAAEPYQFVSNLKAAGVFSDVALIGAQREPVLDGSYFRFEVVCGW